IFKNSRDTVQSVEYIQCFLFFDTYRYIYIHVFVYPTLYAVLGGTDNRHVNNQGTTKRTTFLVHFYTFLVCISSRPDVFRLVPASSILISIYNIAFIC
ncbi:hypothetical protein V1477_015242, partial [Vespula maculifrons]